MWDFIGYLYGISPVKSSFFQISSYLSFKIEVFWKFVCIQSLKVPVCLVFLPDFVLITPKLQSGLSQLVDVLEARSLAHFHPWSKGYPVRGRRKNENWYWRNGGQKRVGGKLRWNSSFQGILLVINGNVMVLLGPWASNLLSWVPISAKSAFNQKFENKNWKISSHFAFDMSGTMVTILAQIPPSDTISGR